MPWAASMASSSLPVDQSRLLAKARLCSNRSREPSRIHSLTMHRWGVSQ